LFAPAHPQISKHAQLQEDTTALLVLLLISLHQTDINLAPLERLAQV
jgi:hypothetical protein